MNTTSNNKGPVAMITISKSKDQKTAIIVRFYYVEEVELLSKSGQLIWISDK